MLYDSTAWQFLQGDDRIEGVRVRHGGRIYNLRAKSIVMACGGFESNAEMRARIAGDGAAAFAKRN